MATGSLAGKVSSRASSSSRSRAESSSERVSSLSGRLALRLETLIDSFSVWLNAMLGVKDETLARLVTIEGGNARALAVSQTGVVGRLGLR